MTGPQEFVFYGLWIAHPILQGLLCAGMLQRKLVKRWPNFFAYTVAQVVFFGIEFVARRHASEEIYFYVSCLSMSFGVAFGFRAIREIYRDVFRAYDALRDLGSLLFVWVGALMVLMAVVIAASADGDGLDWMVAAILILQRSLRVMQCGMVLFLLVFIRHLGLTWRSRSFGIAFGFGLMAVVETILGLLEVRTTGTTDVSTYSLVNMAVYNVAILTWLSYMLMPEVQRQANVLKSKRWNQELGEIRADVSGETLIPRFESIVEAALSQSRPDRKEIAAERTERVFGIQNIR